MHLLGPPPQGCCEKGTVNQTVNGVALGVIFTLTGLCGIFFVHEFYVSGAALIGGLYTGVVSFIHYKQLKGKTNE